MNAALQCLSNTPQLRAIFLRSDAHQLINKHNPIGMQGQIAEAYIDLIRAMWSGSHRMIAPRGMKSSIGKWARQFSGYRQHDSQELLNFLLDALHEDLNSITKKPDVPKIEVDGVMPEAQVAELAWQGYLKRNRSPLIDIFYGQLKSVITCPSCSKVSTTFDPFVYLPLPLPSPKSTMRVTVVTADSMRYPTVYNISVSRDYTNSSDVKDRLLELAPSLPRRLLALTYYYQNRIVSGVANNTPIYPGPGQSVYVFELDHISRQQQKDRELFRLQIVHSRKSSRSVNDVPFCYPLFFAVNPITVTGEELYRLYWQRIQRFLKGDKEQGKDIHDFCVARRATGDVSFPLDVSSSSSTSTSTTTPSTTTIGEGQGQVLSSSLEMPFLLKYDVPYRQACPLCTKATCTGCVIPCDSSVARVEWNSVLVAHWTLAGFESHWDRVEIDRYATHPSAQEGSKEKNPSAISLQDCLELFSQSERLSKMDAWYCPQCKDHKEATKTIGLWRLPDVLIVQLKRFQYVGGRYSIAHRIDTSVSFPATLDLSVMPQLAGQACRYSLIGVIHHVGGMGGGHYTAHAFNNQVNSWFEFNDSHVSQSQGPRSPSGSAYVLFYQREREPPPPSSPPVPTSSSS
ncbi:MAG: hypothetical protein Q8P67_03340 [archaeon]|nr:hypothetical protein [archaeon]